TGDTTFHVRPGLEVRSTGNLTVLVNETDTFFNRRGWNFGSSAWRYDVDNNAATPGEAGFLTLRAAGNLNISSSISDGVASIGTTAANGRLMQEWFQIQSGDSWSYRMTAGADLAAANPLATNTAGTGNFNLADNKLVRTGNGSIDVAAGGDLNLLGA